MPFGRPVVVLAFAVLLALALASTASATYSGSNGKVAWIGHDQHLWLDDPWDQQGPKDLGRVTTTQTESRVQAGAHGPSWSPDGTMLAYTAPVPDTAGLEHSAVFVRDADGSNPRQVSFPDALVPDTCDGQCDNGSAAWDQQPSWTPDGKVAFMRFEPTGDESPKVARRGTTIYTTDPSGGGAPGKVLYVPSDEDHRQLLQSFVWPSSAIKPYLLMLTGSGFAIRNGSATGPVVASAMSMIDLDASPDGSKLAYATNIGGYQIHVIDLDGTAVQTISTPITEMPIMRFSPDGNAILREGCANDRDGNQHCGLVLDRLDDPEGDVRPDDPVVTPYLDLQQIIEPNSINFRSNFDVQGQDLPIVYLPGFLGSEIQCDGTNVWMPALPPLHMQPIALSADGLTNQNCPNAGPTGKPVDKFMGIADVYGHAEKWLAKMHPDGGYKVLGWDWRKRPQESIKALDDTVDQLIADNEVGQKQGASRVSLVGHSYGGLLMRLYVDDPARAKKVARMLTVGSPFWGSTKPFFPLTFGIEAPGFSALDLMIGNQEIKDAMRNFGGAYHLLADDNFGQWLRVDDHDLDQAGVRSFLEEVGGQPHLIDEGWKTHRELLDGWFDDKGRMDVRAVVGVGLLTPRRVIVRRNADKTMADVGIRFGDGDETVPAHSAWQGEPGGPALGDPIHLQRRCGITHMDQTKDLVVQGAYAQFLLFGRTPRKLPEPNCPPTGKLIQVTHNVPIPPPVGAPENGLSATGRAAGGPLALGDAEVAGLADIYNLPGGTQIVTNDVKPVALTFKAQGWDMTITDLKGPDTGTVRRFRALDGDVVLAAGGDAVTVDGKPVAGEVVSEGGGQPSTGGDAPTAAGSGGAAVATGGEGATQQRPPAAKLTASVRGGTFKVSKRGVVTLRVRASGSARGTLALTAKVRGKTTTIARATILVARGEGRVALRLTRAARAALRRAKLRATAVLTLGDLTARAAVTLRR